MNHKNHGNLFIFLKSMKFGIMLLIMVIGLSVLGTLIPQGFDEHFYKVKFSPTVAKLILKLGFNSVYSSILFIVLFAALSLNLVMCSISRFGIIIKNLKSDSETSNMRLLATCSLDGSSSIANTLKEAFNNYGFNNYKLCKAEGDSYISIRNKAGYFGSWMLHLGLLLVIAFYAYGHTTYFSEAVYGVSGTVLAIQGTEYKARIKDFDIEYRADGSVQQYISSVELLDTKENSLKTSSVSVNNPMRFQGYTFYQTSYGWAAKCSVLKSGTKAMEDTIYEKTTLNLPDENIAIYFNKFYPDFAASSKGITSLSDEPKNPVILYTLLYMGEIVRMDVIPIGESIKWNEYEFVLESPQRYTYLNVNKMKGQAGAALGSIMIITGLVIVFYFKPIKMKVKLDRDKLYVYGDAVLEKNIKLKEI